MTRFGEKWHDHVGRIERDWQARVAAQDVVLVLGDLSCASTYKAVQPDLAWLAHLPGRKVLIRGNHDRWWRDIAEVRRTMLPDHVFAIQGDAIEMEGIVLCGAQGHVAPHDPYYRPDPPFNRYERELKTLEAALNAAAAIRQPHQKLIVMMHYPPFTSEGQPTLYSEMIEQHAPALCLYGHLHKEHEWAVAMQGHHLGVEYRLLASDFLGMMLQPVLTVERPTHARD